jgi:[ribosomal protein S18]-alanine N-acetyltransferase
MDCRDIRLEFASMSDAQALALMSRDLIETGLGWAYRRDRIGRLIRHPETVTLVAREGPQVAGFAVMTFGDERAHLVLLAVRPTHRRRGIARRMLEWLLESAATAGMATIHVELRAANPAAFALYRSAGFTETLRVPGYYSGRETAVRMVRMMSAPSISPRTWQPPTLDRH